MIYRWWNALVGWLLNEPSDYERAIWGRYWDTIEVAGGEILPAAEHARRMRGGIDIPGLP